MDKKWETIELLSLHRHDWLNRMQLIKGHLDLGKTEYVKEIVEAIISQSRNEAALSNMDMPKLAELLITCNWRGYPFTVEYEVLQVNQGYREMDEAVSAWVGALLHIIGNSVDECFENSLEVEISQSADELRFTFDLQGKIKDKLAITKFIEEKSLFTNQSIHSIMDDEFILEIALHQNQAT